ncbi:hypothetical protein HD554DRAFT_2039512 [Boletus coccyginus]|nr:hypothetical protein HD554DRAFT_2039512 [Boletus coccyginus]
MATSGHALRSTYYRANLVLRSSSRDRPVLDHSRKICFINQSTPNHCEATVAQMSSSRLAVLDSSIIISKDMLEIKVSAVHTKMYLRIVDDRSQPSYDALPTRCNEVCASIHVMHPPLELAHNARAMGVVWLSLTATHSHASAAYHVCTIQRSGAHVTQERLKKKKMLDAKKRGYIRRALIVVSKVTGLDPLVQDSAKINPVPAQVRSFEIRNLSFETRERKDRESGNLNTPLPATRRLNFPIEGENTIDG